MPKLKNIKEITRTTKRSNPAGNQLNTSDLKNRILDCRGAVTLAIEGILNGDVDSVGAAVGSLSLVERELQQLNIAIDFADIKAHQSV